MDNTIAFKGMEFNIEPDEFPDDYECPGGNLIEFPIKYTELDYDIFQKALGINLEFVINTDLGKYNFRGHIFKIKVYPEELFSDTKKEDIRLIISISAYNIRGIKNGCRSNSFSMCIRRFLE